MISLITKQKIILFGLSYIFKLLGLNLGISFHRGGEGLCIPCHGIHICLGNVSFFFFSSDIAVAFIVFSKGCAFFSFEKEKKS